MAVQEFLLLHLRSSRVRAFSAQSCTRLIQDVFLTAVKATLIPFLHLVAFPLLFSPVFLLLLDYHNCAGRYSPVVKSCACSRLPALPYAREPRCSSCVWWRFLAWAHARCCQLSDVVRAVG